mgnify:CR=1 FL=1
MFDLKLLFPISFFVSIFVSILISLSPFKILKRYQRLVDKITWISGTITIIWLIWALARGGNKDESK